MPGRRRNPQCGKTWEPEGKKGKMGGMGFKQVSFEKELRNHRGGGNSKRKGSRKTMQAIIGPFTGSMQKNLCTKEPFPTRMRGKQSCVEKDGDRGGGTKGTKGDENTTVKGEATNNGLRAGEVSSSESREKAKDVRPPSRQQTGVCDIPQGGGGKKPGGTQLVLRQHPAGNRNLGEYQEKENLTGFIG